MEGFYGLSCHSRMETGTMLPSSGGHRYDHGQKVGMVSTVKEHSESDILVVISQVPSE